MLIKIADIIGWTGRICKFLPKIDRLKWKKGKMKTYWTLIFTLILLGEQPEPSNQRLHICSADYL